MAVNVNVVEENEAKSDNKPKIEAVAKGKKHKKSVLGMFKDSFIADEAKDLKEYIIQDVIVPMVKDAIVDGISSSLSMMFYGEKYEGRRYAGYRRDRYDYARPYSYRKKKKDRDRDDWRDDDRKYGRPRKFEQVECEYRQEALDILEEANELLDRNGSLSIADLYDLASLSSSPEDNNFGWTTLENVRLVHTKDDTFIIDMPRPRCLID